MFNKLIAWVFIFEAIVAFLTILSFGLGRMDKGQAPISQRNEVALHAASSQPQTPR